MALCLDADNFSLNTTDKFNPNSTLPLDDICKVGP
jgi:hypothetical protein